MYEKSIGTKMNQVTFV